MACLSVLQRTAEKHLPFPKKQQALFTHHHRATVQWQLKAGAKSFFSAVSRQSKTKEPPKYHPIKEGKKKKKRSEFEVCWVWRGYACSLMYPLKLMRCLPAQLIEFNKVPSNPNRSVVLWFCGLGEPVCGLGWQLGAGGRWGVPLAGEGGAAAAQSLPFPAI